jgi:hypothetical protein
LPRLDSDHDLPTSTSQVAEITGVNHHTTACFTEMGSYALPVLASTVILLIFPCLVAEIILFILRPSHDR